jgi:hypothetical protein
MAGTFTPYPPHRARAAGRDHRSQACAGNAGVPRGAASACTAAHNQLGQPSTELELHAKTWSRCGSVPEDGATDRARAGLVVPRIGGVRALRLGRRLRGRSRRLRCDGFRLRRCLFGFRLRVGSQRLRCCPFALRCCALALRCCPYAVRRRGSALPRSGFGLGRSEFGLGRSEFGLRCRGRGLRCRGRGLPCRGRGLRFGGRGPRRRTRPAGLNHGSLGVVPQGRLDDLQAPLGLGPPGELGPRQHLLHLRGVVLGELQPDGDRFRLGPARTCHALKVPRTGRSH